MSMIYHIIKSPSYLLTFAGTYLIGDPRKWGINASPEEFYSLPVDRVKANPELRLKAREHSQIMRNLSVNGFRRMTFTRMCIYASIFAVAVLTAGNLMNTGIIKTKQAISSSGITFGKSGSSNSGKTTEQSLEGLMAQAQELQQKHQAGLIPKEDYDRQVKALNDEYTKLLNKEKKNETTTIRKLLTR